MKSNFTCAHLKKKIYDSVVLVFSIATKVTLISILTTSNTVKKQKKSIIQKSKKIDNSQGWSLEDDDEDDPVDAATAARYTVGRGTVGRGTVEKRYFREGRSTVNGIR